MSFDVYTIQITSILGFDRAFGVKRYIGNGMGGLEVVFEA